LINIKLKEKICQFLLPRLILELEIIFFYKKQNIIIESINKAFNSPYTNIKLLKVILRLYKFI
jgi:hypothetical protein